MKTIFYLLLIILFANSCFSQSMRTLDSLVNVLNTTHQDTTKVNTYLLLCAAYGSKDADIAINYGNEGLSLANKIDYKLGIISCYIALSNIYIITGNYDKGLEYLSISLKISQSVNDYKNTTTCFQDIGIIYMHLGKYTLALENLQQALKIAEQFDFKNEMSFCYNNIGVVHYYLGNLTQAIEYYKKSLEINIELKNNKLIGDTYNNIGAIYRQQGMFKEALEQYEQSLLMSQQRKDEIGQAETYSNIGIVHYYQGDYQKTIDFFELSYSLYEKIGDKYKISLVLTNMSELNIKINNYSKAIDLANKGLNIAREIGAIDNVQAAYENLSFAYEAIGKTQDAFMYYKKSIEAKDSLFNKEKLKQLTEMESKYQNEKKQKEIELLEKDKELQATEVKSQKLQKFAFIGGFVFMLVIAFFIFRSYRNKKKANIVLNEKNIEIEQQKEEILAQSEELQEINKELEKLSIVASETDNSVVIANAEGIIEWVNPGFTRMFGYTLQEFIAENGANMVTASSNERFRDIFIECIEKKEAVVYNSTFRTKSGDFIWTQTTINLIFDENKNVTKIIALDTDISKLKQAEEEILQQKEEIITQKDEIESQRDTVLLINKELNTKNKQITDSINYAKLIQLAILPSLSEIQKSFPKSFIFFQPKDIVSGDFYWYTKQDNLEFIALIDCTGHGVPGAFMSMIGNTLLNQIVNEKAIFNPSEILLNLHKGILYALNQRIESTQEDGMEVSLCIIDKDKKVINICGTRQSTYIISDAQLIEYEGNNVFIGNKKYEITIDDFKIGTYSITDNLTIYLTSDGYYDQFGGEKNKKFGSTRFAEMIKSFNGLDLNEQKEIIEKSYIEWKGNFKQIDDVTVIGVKIN